MITSSIRLKCSSGEAEERRPVSPRVRINSRDLLIFANRGTAGKDYAPLIEAVDRLAGTRISTNIRTAEEEQYDTFGLIDAASIRREHGLDGHLLWCEVSPAHLLLDRRRDVGMGGGFDQAPVVVGNGPGLLAEVAPGRLIPQRSM